MAVFKSVRRLTGVLVLSSLLPFFAAHAADFPTKPINFVVPFGPGGTADIQARMLAKAVEPILGQPVVVVNKPGGGTIPGMAESLNAAPDGYTIVWVAVPSIGTQPHLQKIPYTVADIYPIGNVSKNHVVLYVQKDAPWKTFQEFLDAAKTKPLSMGLNGIGALPHLAAVELSQKSAAKFKYIASESSGSAVLQLLGGHVESVMGHEQQAISHGDKIRALAIFEAERSPGLPNVPTAKELGVNVISYTRDGVGVTNKAPAEVKKILVDAFQKAMDKPEFKSEMQTKGFYNNYLGNADTLKMWQEASEHYKKIIGGMK